MMVSATIDSHGVNEGSGRKGSARAVQVGAHELLAHLTVFALLAQLCLPGVRIGGVEVRPAFILAPIIIILCFFGGVRRACIPRESVAVIALVLLAPFTALLSWTWGLSPVSVRDISEAVKFAQYLPCLFAMSVIPYSEFRKAFYLQYPCFLGIFVTVGLLQAAGGSLGVMLSGLYLDINSNHYHSAIIGYRITATGSDPNVGAVIGIVFVLLSLSIAHIRRRKMYIVGALLALCVVFLTQSRTALVALALAGLAALVIMLCGRRQKKPLFALLLLVAGAGYLFHSLDLSYVRVGFDAAVHGQNNSLNVRFERMENAKQRFFQSPIFGHGPAKEKFNTVVDSEYALIIQRYGLLGVVILSLVLLQGLRLAIAARNSEFGVALLFLTPVIVTVMITNNVFSGYQLGAAVFMCWVGAGVCLRAPRYSEA